MILGSVFMIYRATSMIDSVHVVLTFGADSEPLDPVLLEEGAVFLRDDCVLALVAFVDEAVDAVLRRVLPGLLHPVGYHVFKGFGIGDVVDQDDCVGSLVVGFGDASEAFLACGVPDLQFDVVLADEEGSRYSWGYLKRKSMPMVEM